MTKWPMAYDTPGGGVARALRAPCGASSTRYVSMRGLLGSRRVPSTLRRPRYRTVGGVNTQTRASRPVRAGPCCRVPSAVGVK
eukprot:898238-Prymnesium_polylepis.1